MSPPVSSALPAKDSVLAQEILERILRQPTAPFHEHRVRREIRSILEAGGVECRIDGAGNLLARYQRGRERSTGY